MYYQIKIKPKPEYLNTYILGINTYIPDKKKETYLANYISQFRKIFLEQKFDSFEIADYYYYDISIFIPYSSRSYLQIKQMVNDIF